MTTATPATTPHRPDTPLPDTLLAEEPAQALPAAQTLHAAPSGPLTGEVQVPGDKSISHRALMLGGLAVGTTTIRGLLLGADVRATAAAMETLGVAIARGADAWRVHGQGLGGLVEPPDVLDMGNSGTAARLLLGVLAGVPGTAFLTGDASLRKRPMNRVTRPLSAMGAQVTARSGGRLPLAITGRDDLMPLDYMLPVASAQVKSAVLLAGLAAPGVTRVVEPQDTRDHTERMLRAFGADVTVTRESEGRCSALTGRPELTARDIEVPADPSSAAFPLVAALLVPGSRLRLPAVGVNAHRTGLFTTLQEMGAVLVQENPRESGGEPVADLVAEAGPLRGVEVPAARAPSMIDEYPILAMAAACAEGRTVMHGVGELRVKESDRLSAVAEGLRACGVEVAEGHDWLAVEGLGHPPRGGARIATHLDHRIAMSFLVLGLAADQPVAVDDAGPIDTSFPNFVAILRGLGAMIGPDDTAA